MKYEIVIRPDGKMVRRTLIEPVEHELDVNDEITKLLADGLVVKAKNVAFLKDWGLVHFSARAGNTSYWTVDLDHIPMLSHYTMKNGSVVPVFEKFSDEPLLPLVWQNLNDSLRLKMLIQTSVNGYGTVQMVQSFLFAYSFDNRCWRLPLANLFENCKLCLGDITVSETNSLDCLRKTLEQFARAQWNSDLAEDDKTLHERFFRFHPDNDGFSALPIDAEDWTSLCVKIAVPEMELVVL